jgi:hypothetical protein
MSILGQVEKVNALELLVLRRIEVVKRNIYIYIIKYYFSSKYSIHYVLCYL